MIANIRKKRLYKILVWTGVAVCAATLLWRGSVIFGGFDWYSRDDFVDYWSAGRLNLLGINPYDSEQSRNLQTDAGIYNGGAVLMWNPPWILSILMPFAIFNYPFSRLGWLLISLLIVFLSSNTLWVLYRGNDKFRWVSWLLGLTFLPVLDLFQKGQTGVFILLGVVGFLYFTSQRRFLLAGVALSFLLVKPHLGYLFLLAVGLWTLSERVWPVIWGFIGAVLISILVAWIPNQNVISQYLFAISNFPPLVMATPTLGGIMRLLVGIEHAWLQFLPPLIGSFWFLIYWYRNRKSWDWISQAPILIIISIVTAAYYWSFDQAVLLIAIIQVFAILSVRKLDYISGLIIFVYILIDIFDLISPPNEILLWWLAPSLLLWYLASRWLIDRKTDYVIGEPELIN